MITRENYEEFFLSYVDNELPAETRLAVEHFVAANPDLREELETLVQCRLEPEPDAVFSDSRSLLRYEESLLLYVDDELDEAGRKTVEELASREPRIGLELEQLRLTVSRPDTSIVFPGKAALYHPAKRRRVVMMPWLQATAAAAVIAAVVLQVLPRWHKADVAIADAKDTGVAVAGSRTSEPTQTAISGDATKNTAITVTINDSAAFHSIKVLKETTQKREIGGTTKINDAAAVAARSKRTHDSLSVLPAPVVAETKPTVDSSNNTQLATTVPAHSEKAAATSVAAVNIPKEQRSFATQQLMREAQEEGDGDMASNMPPTTGKTKLRGLFRRVTRTLGKTADRDDDGGREVSISVFQVALK